MSESRTLQALLLAQRHVKHERGFDIEFSQIEWQDWRVLEIYTNHSCLQLYCFSRFRKKDQPRFKTPLHTTPWQKSHHPEVEINYVIRNNLQSMISLRFKCHASLKRLYISNDKTFYTVIPMAKIPQFINALRFLFPRDKHHAVDELAIWIEETMGTNLITQ